MSKKTDLLFIRALHYFVHIGLIIGYVKLFLISVQQFQDHDQSIRSLFDSNPNKCINYSTILEDIIVQKNECGRHILLLVSYTMAMFVSSLLIINNNIVIITLFLMFQIGVLGVNLFTEILTPIHSLALFMSSTVMNVFYVSFYALPDCNKRRPPQPISLRYHPDTPPTAPKFSELDPLTNSV